MGKCTALTFYARSHSQLSSDRGGKQPTPCSHLASALLWRPPTPYPILGATHRPSFGATYPAPSSLLTAITSRRGPLLSRAPPLRLTTPFDLTLTIQSYPVVSAPYTSLCASPLHLGRQAACSFSISGIAQITLSSPQPPLTLARVRRSPITHREKCRCCDHVHTARHVHRHRTDLEVVILTPASPQLNSICLQYLCCNWFGRIFVGLRCIGWLFIMLRSPHDLRNTTVCPIFPPPTCAPSLPLAPGVACRLSASAHSGRT